MTKKNSSGGMLNVLAEHDVERIDEAALSLLEKLGICSESEMALDVMARGGAQVDRDTRIVRVPRSMVRAALDAAPKQFAIYGRDPEMDLWIESGRVYYGMGGTSEPFFYDYDLGRPRQSTKADMVNNTRVGQALRNVDFIMTLCSASDVPQGQNYFHEYDAIMRNTGKPIVISVLGQRSTERFLEMAAAACGGEEALRQRPWGMAIVTPVSPLKFDHLNEGLWQAAQFNVPILYSPGPMMGATGPATVAGTLALSLAETLFGLVLAQLIRPGLPVLFKTDTNAMDMATGQCTYGSPEQDLGHAAMAQMARFYGMPTFTIGAGAESKLPDAEAAAESLFGMMLNALSGINLTQTMGTLASGFYGSIEMAVICDEMAQMVKRVLQGVTVTDDSLALDVIEQVGHGGQFLQHEHTLSHYKQELYFPSLFRRQTVQQWIDRGGKPIHQVAHEKVKQILAKAEPVPLPPGADEELQRALSAGIREVEAAGGQQL